MLNQIYYKNFERKQYLDDFIQGKIHKLEDIDDKKQIQAEVHLELVDPSSHKHDFVSEIECKRDGKSRIYSRKTAKTAKSAFNLALKALIKQIRREKKQRNHHERRQHRKIFALLE